MLRAFIAIELQESIQNSINRFQQELKTSFVDAPIRWVPAHNIHLTLKFLGDTPIGQIDSILKVLEKASEEFEPFMFTIEGFGVFPSNRRPRVLWLGIGQSQGALERLQHGIEQAVLALKYEPEKRSFHPHLTLGRVKQSATSHQLSILSRQIEIVPQPSIGLVKVDQVHLYSSRLGPSGAEYSHLGSCWLRGAG